jgi:acetylornithine deacetylase
MKIDQEEVLRLLKRLIEIKSVNPNMENGEGEAEISDFIADYLESLKIEVHTQPVVDDRHNVIGILKGEGNGRSLMLNGHMDTVSVKGMIRDPFKPFIDNGNMHGRGACDMKGGLAAMLVAMKTLVDSGTHLKGDLLFSGVVDEEYKSIGTEELVKKYRSDAAVIGEPTDLEIGVAHKGFVWLEIETYGKAAHGSVPEKGIDAIANMTRIISSMYSLKQFFSKKKHYLVGSPTIHSSTIEGGEEWSVIPDFCRLRVECRTIPGENSSTVIGEINQIINRLSREDPFFNAKVKQIFERQPVEISPNEDVVKCLEMAFKDVRHTGPKIVGEPYWSEASLFVNDASIPACLFGPGNINVAHSADEYVGLRDVIDSVRIYALAAQSFCASSTS